MIGWSIMRMSTRQLIFWGLTTLLSMGAFLGGSPRQAYAQNADNRVVWQIVYDDALSKSDRNTIQANMIKTLARASERHFVGDDIISQKIKKEGLNFPECFTEGKPCSKGGAFILDVHNVDAFARANFSKVGNEWQLDLTLYRNASSSAVSIKRGSNNLENLIASVAGSLFDMESMIEVKSNVPDVEVYINQKLVGMTPLSMKVPVGSQSVTFKKPGYVPETWDFTAEKGNVHSKDVNLVPETVQLTVLVSDPAATIDIDGKPWGGANESHEVLPGEKKIDIQSKDFNDFSMDYKVYPGNPQTINVALLPKSEDPYTIRHRGISKYRFSVSLGYHLAHQSFSLGNKSALLDEGEFFLPTDKWANAWFHGLSVAANYEDKYWGISLFRLDFGGSGLGKDIQLSNRLSTEQILSARADNAIFVGFYPAQLKAHYTFWVMQAEAVAGVGLSHLKVWADINDLSLDYPIKHKSFERTAFSINFDIALKFFFSEESFAMLGYDLQYDFEPKNSKSTVRHGMTIGFGYQLPFLMRQDVAAEPEVVEDMSNVDDVDFKVNE